MHAIGPKGIRCGHHTAHKGGIKQMVGRWTQLGKAQRHPTDLLHFPGLFGTIPGRDQYFNGMAPTHQSLGQWQHPPLHGLLVARPERSDEEDAHGTFKCDAPVSKRSACVALTSLYSTVTLLARLRG